jgi:hypothetical protein
VPRLAGARDGTAYQPGCPRRAAPRRIGSVRKMAQRPDSGIMAPWPPPSGWGWGGPRQARLPPLVRPLRSSPAGQNLQYRRHRRPRRARGADADELPMAVGAGSRAVRVTASAELAAVDAAERRTALLEPTGVRAARGLVHVWSTCHRNRAVRSGLQRCLLVQVAGAILRRQGRVQSADKDETGGSSPPRPTKWPLISRNAGHSPFGS